MRSRRLDDMRDEAAALCSLQGFVGTDSRYTTAEVNRKLNQGIARVWDLLVSRMGFGYYGKTHYTQSIYAQSAAGPSLTGAVLAPPNFKESTSAKTLTVTVTVPGALGTAAFRYSFSGEVANPTVYITPASGNWSGTDGIVIAFVSGTYVSGEVYTFTFGLPSTVVGQVSYDLPNDFYKVHKMWVGQPAQSGCWELTRVRPADEPLLRRSGNSTTPVAYECRQNYVDILPAAATVYPITLLYVPCAPTLIADSDTFDGINGYEDFPIAFAAYYMAVKEGEYELQNAIKQIMNDAEQRITTAGVDRDRGTAQVVTDSRGALPWKSRTRNRSGY